jgi:hypothetical protein
MSSDYRLTKEGLWDSVLQSASLTLKLLSHLQDEKHPVIQSALPALKALVEVGPSISMAQEDKDSTLNQNQIQYQPRIELNQQVPNANWTVLTPNQVEVKLNDDNVVTARTVTTDKELDALIRKMYRCDVVALDCEFMTTKKNDPLLKVLQVAVSKSEGYAIIIDKLDPKVIQTKLKAVLEDSTINYVAWAFKTDALAITATIGDIQIAPVLDLQSKLTQVAVEKLNLFSGITKFAPDWEGLKEFQKAKLLGVDFDYHEGKCIWSVDPIPVPALVYAIFDVVSLIVLTETTVKYPTAQSHFWPNNFDQETPKAKNRYKQKLEYASSAAQQRYLATQSQQPVSPQTTNRSINQHPSHNQSDSPSIKHNNNNNIHTSPTQASEAMNQRLNTTKSEDGICFSPEPHKMTPPPTTATATLGQHNSWGEFSKQEHSTYLDKSASPRTTHSTPPVKNAALSSRSSFKSPGPTYQNIPTSPKRPEKTPDPPTTIADAFASKPDISKAHNIVKNSSGVVVSDQKVTFTGEENVPGGPEITTWRSFADSTIQEWGKKKDVGIEAFDDMKTTASPKAANVNNEKPDKQVSEWDKLDDRPQYMQMKLRQIPMRSTFTGPKAMNPNDSDEDDEDEDDDDYQDQNRASDRLDVKFESKWQQIHSQNSSLSRQSSPSSRPSSTGHVSPASPKLQEPSNEVIDVEDLSIYQDSLYLFSGEALKMCKITTPDELNKIILPPLNKTSTVVITFHCIYPSTNGRPRLKGLQIYIPNGESYVVVVDQACFDRKVTPHSKIATLLTHPSIQRLAWLTDPVINEIKTKMGISLGRTVDVSKKANDIGQAHGSDFQSNIKYYLKDWGALEQFNGVKENYEKGVGKKFSTVWDKEPLPTAILEYCSLAGAALYNLYQHPDLKAVSDQPYLY